MQTVRRFKDSSRLVHLPVRRKGQPRVIEPWIEVREIHGRVQRPGHRAPEWRLWTSLPDPTHAPAQELIELYARRWEHELYYRELKRPLRKREVLQSHTVETGAQEIAAVVLASALLARKRARAAAGEVPVLRISFLKTLAIGGELLSHRQKQQLTEKFLAFAGRWCVTRRRKRPCSARGRCANRSAAGPGCAAINRGKARFIST